MKNKLFILALLSASSLTFAQVGINTGSPQATLDVTGMPATKNMLDGIIAPRLTGDQLRAKNYTPAQTGAIVYVTVADSAPAGQTENVTSAGYYYFDGAEWSNMGTNWHTDGNHNTSAPLATLGNDISGGNYLGTTDDQKLVIATKKNVKAILDVDGNFSGGNANSVSGPYASFAWGSNNVLTNNTSSNIALGKDNTVSAQGNFPALAVGLGNTANNGAKVIGNNNTASGANNLVFGNSNTSLANTATGLTFGISNTNKGGIIVGSGNSASSNNFVFGFKNVAENATSGSVVIGFYGTSTAGNQTVYANTTHAFLGQNNGSSSVVGINMAPTANGSTGAAIQIKGFASAANATCTAAEEGAIRYNSTTKSHEGCNGTNWKAFY